MTAPAEATAALTRAAEIAHARPIAPTGKDGLVCNYIPAKDGMPTVLFLHGWVMNRTTWADAAVPLLDAGYGLLLPDLPGHGSSPALPRVQNTRVYDAMAERLVAVLDALSLEEVHVAGYSMGATVGLALARQSPERVASLYLLDPIVHFPLFQMASAPLRLHARFVWNMIVGGFGPRGLHLWRSLIGLFFACFYLPWPVKRWFLSLFDFEHDTEDVSYLSCRDDVEVQLYLDGFVCTPWWVTAQAIEAKFRVDYREVFETFPRPIFIGAGDDDVFASPRFIRRMARRGKKGPRGEAHRTAVFEGKDHLVVCTNPNVVGESLKRWLDGQSHAPSLEASNQGDVR